MAKKAIRINQMEKLPINYIYINKINFTKMSKEPTGKRQIGLTPIQKAYLKKLTPSQRILLLFKIIAIDQDYQEDKKVVMDMINVAERIGSKEYENPTKEIVDRFEIMFESGDYTLEEMDSIRSAIDLINRLQSEYEVENN